MLETSLSTPFGRKLAGSAQRRQRGAILQHGSIRMAPDPPEAARAAGLRPGRATSLAELGWRGGTESLGAPSRPKTSPI